MYSARAKATGWETAEAIIWESHEKIPWRSPRILPGNILTDDDGGIVEIKVQDTPWIILAGTAKAELSMLSEYMNTARSGPPAAAM